MGNRHDTAEKLAQLIKRDPEDVREAGLSEGRLQTLFQRAHDSRKTRGMIAWVGLVVVAAALGMPGASGDDPAQQSRTERNRVLVAMAGFAAIAAGAYASHLRIRHTVSEIDKAHETRRGQQPPSNRPE